MLVGEVRGVERDEFSLVSCVEHFADWLHLVSVHKDFVWLSAEIVNHQPWILADDVLELLRVLCGDSRELVCGVEVPNVAGVRLFVPRFEGVEHRCLAVANEAGKPTPRSALRLLHPRANFVDVADERGFVFYGGFCGKYKVFIFVPYNLSGVVPNVVIWGDFRGSGVRTRRLIHLCEVRRTRGELPCLVCC